MKTYHIIFRISLLFLLGLGVVSCVPSIPQALTPTATSTLTDTPTPAPTDTLTSTPTDTATLTPTNVPAATLPPSLKFAAISAGGDHTCGLVAGGEVQCWGDNYFGQLGDGTTANSALPGRVVELRYRVSAIAAGVDHTCVLTIVGGVQCWGDNESGQLGDGTTTNSTVPVDVIGLTSGVSAISAGWKHTCALTSGGGVKCWGNNYSGQLGDGTITTDPPNGYGKTMPVDVIGLTSGVSAIAAGGQHTCALTTNGRVKCWGYNGAGQLGDGKYYDSSTPVNVSELTSGVSAIAAGGNNTCALTAVGGVKCWGDNMGGQLGINMQANLSDTPVDVVGLTSGISAIVVGFGHSCAQAISGGVRCWGDNEYGQLGDGSIKPSGYNPSPVYVVWQTTWINAITAGNHHTCALISGGEVMCWGDDSSGQLGNGAITNGATPVMITPAP